MAEQIVTPASTPALKGWVERLRLDALSQKLNLSHYSMIDFIISFAVGIVIGVIWKRYTHYVIAAIVFVIGMALLSQFNFINVMIDWPRIYSMIGLHPASSDAGVAAVLWDWAKDNLILVVCGAIGFILGIKVS